MANEDFTTYTEQDDSDEITITSSRITFTTLAIDETAYVTKDFGADHFGDFRQRFTLSISEQTVGAGPSPGGSCSIWGVSAGAAIHTVADFYGDTDGFMLYVYSNLANQGFVLVELDGGSEDAYVVDAAPFTYYIEVERAGTALTAKFYSDSGYTTLLKTLSLTCVTDTFRYLTPLGGYEGASDDDTITGYIENLDLDPSAPGHLVSTLGGATYSGISSIGGVAIANISTIGGVSDG